MSKSRDKILQTLRQAARPFPETEPPRHYEPMVPLETTDPHSLQDRFMEYARQAGCHVYGPLEETAARNLLVELCQPEQTISSWSASETPIQGLHEALTEHNITLADPADPGVHIGITGVDAALAATGSLILSSGPGKYRAPSLLPLKHIAVIKTSQILPDLESWAALEKAEHLKQLRASSNVVVITGPSRTADIAMTLVMGMHGPKEVHVVLVEG